MHASERMNVPDHQRRIPVGAHGLRLHIILVYTAQFGKFKQNRRGDLKALIHRYVWQTIYDPRKVTARIPRRVLHGIRMYYIVMHRHWSACECTHERYDALNRPRLTRTHSHLVRILPQLFWGVNYHHSVNAQSQEKRGDQQQLRNCNWPANFLAASRLQYLLRSQCRPIAPRHGRDDKL